MPLWNFAPCSSPLASCPGFQIPQRKFPSIILSKSPRAIFSPLGRPQLFLIAQVLFSSVVIQIGAGQLWEPGNWAPGFEAGSLCPVG